MAYKTSDWIGRQPAYQAASQVKSVAQPISTAAALEGPEGHILDLRAQDALRNSGPLVNAVRLKKTTVVGNATPRATENTPRAKGANDAWKAWATGNVGYRHQFGTFAQVVGRFVMGALASGESYLRRIQTDERSIHPNGMVLQGWNKRDIDKSKGEYGHVYSASGAIRVGTWFQDRSQLQTPGRHTSIFVNERDLVSLRLSDNHDQVSGQSSLAASLTADKMARAMSLAELNAANLRASIGGIAIGRTNPFNGEYMNPGYAKIAGPNGESIQRMTPGTFPITQGIEDVKWSPHAQSDVNHGVASADVAAGVSLTTELISGTASKASFSALTFSALMLMVSSELFSTESGYQSALDKVLEWFILAEAASGRNWLGLSWKWPHMKALIVDPLKKARALKIYVEDEIMAKSQARQEIGLDPDVTEELVANEKEAEPDADEGDANDDSERSNDFALRRIRARLNDIDATLADVIAA